MFGIKKIQKNLQESKIESEIEDRVEKIWNLIKEVKSDNEKSEIMDRVRLKVQVYIETTLSEVSEHKLDLERELERLTSPICKKKVKEEIGVLDSLKNVFTLKGGSSKTKDENQVAVTG